MSDPIKACLCPVGRDQVAVVEGELRALRGVVQSLMLTSHLLFIGFGFNDVDFFAMAEAVHNLRELADDHVDSLVGTAISLGSRENRHADLDHRHMREDEDTPLAARCSATVGRPGAAN